MVIQIPRMTMTYESFLIAEDLWIWLIFPHQYVFHLRAPSRARYAGGQSPARSCLAAGASNMIGSDPGILC